MTFAKHHIEQTANDSSRGLEFHSRLFEDIFMRRWLILLFGLPLLFSVSAQTTSPKIGDCNIFPADNIWNARVDSLPLDPRSNDYVTSIGIGTGLHPDFGTFYLGAPIGIPFTTVGNAQPLVNISYFPPPDGYESESDAGPMPIPPNAPVEGGDASSGDRHVLVVNTDSCKLYELFNAHKQNDNSWKVSSSAVYDLNSNALRPDGWTSADAAGLPILPGLVRYDEMKSGEIEHAIRFTASITQRKYVWQARHFASSNTSLTRPPMGQRFRLKANVDLSRFPPDMQIIFTAFKRYGIILADNGSNWYITGTHDTRWDDDMLVSAFRQLKGSDFEAVDVSSLKISDDSAQVKGANVTPAPTATVPNYPPRIWLPVVNRR
jgi:hypothetical protein